MVEFNNIKERVKVTGETLKYFGDFMYNSGFDTVDNVDKLDREEILELAYGLGLEGYENMSRRELESYIYTYIKELIDQLNRDRKELREVKDIIKSEGKSVNELTFDEMESVVKHRVLENYRGREKLEVSLMTVGHMIEIAKILEEHKDVISCIVEDVVEVSRKENKDELEYVDMMGLLYDILTDKDVVRVLGECYDVIRISGPKLEDMTLAEFMFVVKELRFGLLGNFM